MAEEVSPPAEPTRRVLVIDRNATVALMICGLLRRWGFHAERDKTPAGDSGVGETDWDLVIADPQGAPARLAALRRQGVPWIALVSAGDARDSADAASWIYKPIESSELQDAVTRCLDSKPATTNAGVDTSAIVELWGSLDHAGFRQVANAFLGEIETRLISIAEALATNNRKTLHLEAHSVGGAAANVGGVAIARAARAVEAIALDGDLARLRALVDVLETTSRRDLPALRRLAVGGLPS
jgi:HPt (histidine-containing phosphotransfer) domain-containing protein